VYLKSLPLHSNIISLDEIEWVEGKLRVSMPLYRCDLYNYIKTERKNEPLPLNETLSISRQILCGLDHLHSHGIFHRDLKSANVLLGANGTAVICDFSLASNFVAKIEHSTTVQTLW